MTRQAIINRTIEVINRLPEEQANEISDFANFLFTKYENQLLTNGIQKMMLDSKSFEFLEEEEELYSIIDLKEKFNG